MNLNRFHHFTDPINLESLRYFILDEHITAQDLLVLNMMDFDEVALQYREVYQQSVCNPFEYMGVSIALDTQNLVSQGAVMILEQQALQQQAFFPEDDLVIYRCSICGNLVDYDGAELEETVWKEHQQLMRKHRHEIVMKTVEGFCCR